MFLNKLYSFVFKGRRKHIRRASEALFSIHTSFNKDPIALRAKDISECGAFIRSEDLPEVNEVIGFSIISDNLFVCNSGKAQVVWICDSDEKNNRGFGVKFENELYKEVIDPLIKADNE